MERGDLSPFMLDGLPHKITKSESEVDIKKKKKSKSKISREKKI